MFFALMEFERRLSNLFLANSGIESNTTVALKSLTAFSQIPLVYNSVSTKIDLHTIKGDLGCGGF